ncbi:MAG TPA: ATP-binding protein [Spirochaetota bacterium]|nr:ATP-binding protein [Spirochaetota bacterium]HPC41059.1 ATP-binding protein [Spirochaetota bacterium]HPL18789.1 ATP-binding protein [Spirochaetota bacterium]HQF08828.1 ATP-binding protein [Spirochaetota bacterium]HQH97447.1 ATP-binding protein [Spirochaetota bacterium]
MNDNVIIVPNRFKDQYEFEYVIDLQDRILGDVRDLNLSRLSFIEPYSMLSLLLMGRNYLRKSGNKLKLSGIPINIHQYLHRMDFFKTGVFEVTERLNEKMLLKRSSFSNRVIEITEIPNKERESVKVISSIVGVFRKRAAHILKYWLTDRIIDYFVTVISEICQNIYEHSLDSGYLAMQTYSIGKENIVRLSIGDSGIGIQKSFENFDITYDSPAHLMELALTTPISSKREFGYGLCQVNAIVEKLKGSIFLRSGNASVSTLYHRKGAGASVIFQKNELSHFDGTQISISLMG